MADVLPSLDRVQPNHAACESNWKAASLVLLTHLALDSASRRQNRRDLCQEPLGVRLVKVNSDDPIVVRKEGVELPQGAMEQTEIFVSQLDYSLLRHEIIIVDL